MTPMQLGTAAETEILRTAAVIGVFMGMLYDMFAIIRHMVNKRVLTFVCDLLYALAFGAVFFVASLYMTGYYRGFVLAGMLIGAAMWCLTIGRALRFAAEKLIAAVIKHIISPVFALIHKIFSQFARGFVRIAINFKKLKKIPKST